MKIHLCRCIPARGLLYMLDLTMWECGTWGLSFGHDSTLDNNCICVFTPHRLQLGTNILFRRMPVLVAEPVAVAHDPSRSSPVTEQSMISPVQLSGWRTKVEEYSVASNLFLGRPLITIYDVKRGACICHFNCGGPQLEVIFFSRTDCIPFNLYVSSTEAFIYLISRLW